MDEFGGRGFGASSVATKTRPERHERSEHTDADPAPAANPATAQPTAAQPATAKPASAKPEASGTEFPGIAPPANWFLATPASDAGTRPEQPAVPQPRQAPAPQPRQAPVPPPRRAPAQSGPSVWHRSHQLWIESGIQWERPPAPQRTPAAPRPADQHRPPEQHRQAEQHRPVEHRPAEQHRQDEPHRQHPRLLSQPVGRHAKQSPRQAQRPRTADASAPVLTAPAPVPALVAAANGIGHGTNGNGHGPNGTGHGNNGTAKLPPLASVQFLGAPVQMSSHVDGQAPGQEVPGLLNAPEWADYDTVLLNPALDPDLDFDGDPDFGDDDEDGRRFLAGRRVTAVAAPALVLGVVGALAFTLLTGHGPKFDQLSSRQENQPDQPATQTPATGSLPAYSGLQQRGVFESVSRIVASGSTMVATAQRGGGTDGTTRQVFYVSTDGGATWRLAAISGSTAPGHVAPLLAGGQGGWIAVGPQAIWTSKDGASWTLAATHGISQVPGDQVWVVTKTASGYVAGGSDAQNQGVVWTSADGLNWHRQIIGTHVQNIAYATAHGNDVLVTGTLADGSSGAWLSTDGGSAWTPVTIPVSHGAAPTIAGIAWDNGFVAVRDGAKEPKTYFSHNGTSWSYAGTITAPEGLRPRVVKADAYGVVVAGQNDAGQLVAYLSTDNGASWRPTATLGNAAAESVVGAAVAPGDNVIAIGATAANQVSQRPVFLVASAANVHTVVLPGVNAPEVAVNAMAAAGGQRIAVGSADGYPAIWRQTGDGWSLVTKPDLTGARTLAALTGVTHGPAGWLAVGATLDGSRSLILTSPDGVTWHALGGTAALAAADFLAAAAGPAGYAVVGEQITEHGSVPAAAWFSADLAHGTKADGLAGPGQMLAVAATSTGFIAVGTANGQPAVWKSADGKTWHLTDLSPAGATLRQVTASGNQVTVTGTNAAGAPLTLQSANGGTTWQPAAR